LTPTGTTSELVQNFQRTPFEDPSGRCQQRYLHTDADPYIKAWEEASGELDKEPDLR